MNDRPFESALAQLPELVDEWRKKLDTEVAELIKIPSHLSFKSTSDGRVVSSTSTTGSESSQAATGKPPGLCIVQLWWYDGPLHPS